MLALPFVQVIVSLSSDFNALSLTVTVALVAALLAAKALLKNFSSYSPAGKGVDVVVGQNFRILTAPTETLVVGKFSVGCFRLAEAVVRGTILVDEKCFSRTGGLPSFGRQVPAS